MPSPETNARTRKEWRDLGFFYDGDDSARLWRLVGSRAGLGKFVDLLRRYVADPRNAKLSEHEHYGPYMYLEVMTWTEPRLDDHAISGKLDDLARLADLVEAGLSSNLVHRFRLGPQWAPAGPFDLEVEVASDDFDPGSADPYCQET